MTLYLFTNSFPYDYGESFLESEISFLSEKFSSIVIIPLWQKEKSVCRNVPSNCFVLPPIIYGKTRNNLRGLNGVKCFSVFIKDFITNKVYLNKKKFRSWLKTYFILNCIVNNKSIKIIAKQINNEDICYFYWGVGFINLALLWRNKAKFVARFHATYDLWEERRGGYTPLRKQVVPCLSDLFFISNLGKIYFVGKYPNARASISRLGTCDYGISSKSSDNVLRVLSCSNVIPLKRVPLIMQSLAVVSKGKQVEWTHIGDGVEMEKLQKMKTELQSDSFSIILLGQKSHIEVLNYYKNKPIDLFINLSTSEGVPVSIMEAISFNIPCVATDVGATKEIVTKEVGLLLNVDANEYQVANAINKALSESFSPKKLWAKYYNANKNYFDFSTQLSNI